MTRYPFAQVDAFADRPFTGNPAGVVQLDRWLGDAALLAIAAETNLPETAFTVPADGDAADHELRWFTPMAEVMLCGHATLAAGHVLLGERAMLRFATRRAGVLTVARDDDGYALGLPALRPAPRDLPALARIAGGRPTAGWWHDAGYAVLLYAHEAEVRALAPDLAALRDRGDIALIVTAPGGNTDVVSRVFVPGAGVDEDHVTGSAHAVIASIWADRLGRSHFTAEQASARGGRLGCRLEGDRVILSGRCVTVIEGWLLV